LVALVETWLQKHYATQHYVASSVNWIFKEQGQVDLELQLSGDAIAAARAAVLSHHQSIPLILRQIN